MGYLLIAPNILEEKGIKYFERVPDGRGIVDFSLLRLLGNLESVQVVSSKKDLDTLIREQEQSGLYDKPTTLPELGGEIVGEEEFIDEGFSVDPNTDSTDENIEDAEIIEDNTIEKEV